jgi:uncharacterized membrane protein
MSTTAVLPVSNTNWLRRAARLFVIAWAFFWSYFLLANLFDNTEIIPESEKTKGYMIIFSALILVWGASFFAWKKERIGGLVLLMLGIALAALYLMFRVSNLAIGDQFVTAALLGLLPIVSGVLFFLAAKR